MTYRPRSEHTTTQSDFSSEPSGPRGCRVHALRRDDHGRAWRPASESVQRRDGAPGPRCDGAVRGPRSGGTARSPRAGRRPRDRARGRSACGGFDLTHRRVPAGQVRRTGERDGERFLVTGCRRLEPPANHRHSTGTRLHNQLARPDALARGSPPPVPSFAIRRMRLEERLDGHPDRHVVLVRGPAGAGKTVLVSQWAGALTQPCAWLSIDTSAQRRDRSAAAVGRGGGAALPGRFRRRRSMGGCRGHRRHCAVGRPQLGDTAPR